MASSSEQISPIKPQRLAYGDLIGVISPAGPVIEDELEPGLEILRSLGYGIRVAPHVYGRKGYLSGTDDERLSDFHSMFKDGDIKAIFCARGGYGSMRLLERIQYEQIRNNPKIIVGYSDITALLVSIYQKTGLITFHGPMIREFAGKDIGNYENLLNLLSSKNAMKLELSEGVIVSPGRATGKLIGGNLTVFCHLIGTSYLPSLEGCILFFEDKEEPLYRIDRMLTQLKLSGLLKKIAGMVFGDFEGCGDVSSVIKLLENNLSDYNIPISTGLRAGHGIKNLPLPIGSEAELNTDLGALQIIEHCVR